MEPEKLHSQIVWGNDFTMQLENLLKNTMVT